jgi:MATE family multidrug resistance protein
MNAALNYYLVWRTSLGFIGAPTATVITHWTMAISLMFYTGIYGSRDAWPGWTMRIFSDYKSWKYMIHLASSGVIMLCSEIWSWEVIIFSSSFLGVKSLAANSILMVLLLLHS